MLNRVSSKFKWPKPFDLSNLEFWNPCIYLNSNDESSVNYLALGEKSNSIDFHSGDHFESLKLFHDQKKDWLFGYLSYDLKNELEALSSRNPASQEFSQLHFFQPKLVLEWIGKDSEVTVHYFENDYSKNEILDILNKLVCNNQQESDSKPIIFKERISKREYCQRIEELLDEIQYGNIYEANFCQEFVAEKAQLNPYSTYHKLNKLSPVPFSSFLKLDNQYAMCASPERFLKKSGTGILSQPIKGTIRRGLDSEEDERLRNELANSSKDRNENVMIVDLVRNDLSKSAKKSSVKVDELFGVYTFPQVHQLISTVSCELRDDIHLVDAIKNAFPMGSMTGVPKEKAMQIIEDKESFKRQLYSGAIGYISPEGDFDFNVVIRSLFYNKELKKLSFAVGGAITSKSTPEAEYEESLLKAKAIFELFEA